MLDSISIIFTKIPTINGEYICNPKFSIKKSIVQKMLKLDYTSGEDSVSAI